MLTCLGCGLPSTEEESEESSDEDFGGGKGSQAKGKAPGFRPGALFILYGESENALACINVDARI